MVETWYEMNRKKLFRTNRRAVSIAMAGLGCSTCHSITMNTRSHPEQPSVGLSATRARASYSYSQTYHAAFSTQLKPVHAYPLHHAPSPGNLDGKNSISFLHAVFFRVCVYCCHHIYRFACAR